MANRLLRGIRRSRVVTIQLVLGFLLVSCTSGSTDSSGAATSPPTLDPNLGGETSREDTSKNAFGQSAFGLSADERKIFERGDSFFTQNWVTAPSSTEARDGLGPTFNAQACSSCHVRDGRGKPPDPETTVAELGLLLRISVPGENESGGPLEVPGYGNQIQDKALQSLDPEAKVSVEYEMIEGTYTDGEAYELSKPTYTIVDPAYGELPDDLMLSPRLAPHVIGAGLLEEIPEQDILANTDIDDADGDGISGKPNTVWDKRAQTETLGRFGWKANTPTVEQQVADAFHGDIGITSALNPQQNCPVEQIECAAAITGGEPELTDERLGTVTFYNRTLAVPTMRDSADEKVLEGYQAFNEFSCSSCHIQNFTTGDSPTAALANQNIQPYTDLLLHDMGEGLADGRPDFEAAGNEWRTPPLWGIGLIDEVNDEAFFLHDGRARNLEEAILWHGGEAEKSQQAFVNASKDQREKVIKFLESL